MLMWESGMENIFESVPSSWACVPEADVLSANPDVMVVVDAVRKTQIWGGISCKTIVCQDRLRTDIGKIEGKGRVLQAWDPATSKIDYLFDHVEFCNALFVESAKFVTIPFSASTLSPRNGRENAFCVPFLCEKPNICQDRLGTNV